MPHELDFQSMIANAKQQHEQRIQRAKDKAEKAREARTRMEDAGTTWLKRHIILRACQTYFSRPRSCDRDGLQFWCPAIYLGKADSVV
jgi:hypothetical protein